MSLLTGDETTKKLTAVKVAGKNNNISTAIVLMATFSLRAELLIEMVVRLSC